MRPGLVVAGVLLCVLGGAAVATFYLYPAPTNQEVERTGSPAPLLAGSTTNFTIEGLPGPSPEFTLSWSASSPVNVSLYASSGCTGGTNCAASALLTHWTDGTGGRWSHGGPLPFPLVLLVHVPANASASYSYSATTTVRGGPATSGLMGLLVDLAGGALLAIGGIAAFLGLFLRSNPYGPRPPLVPASAEALDDLARTEGEARGGPPPP